MKHVLLYGDSNTWGADPAGGPRFDEHTRWGGVLRGRLGAGWWVVEEGLPGRTTAFEDAVEGEYLNGARYLLPCLRSHRPLDWVVILLGTNSLKARFSVSAADIALSAERLVRIVQHSESGPADGVPQILLISPPPLAHTGTGDMFAGGVEKSHGLAAAYAAVAAARGVRFLDAGAVIVSSAVDGIHWDAPEHAKLAAAVAAVLTG